MECLNQLHLIEYFAFKIDSLIYTLLVKNSFISTKLSKKINEVDNINVFFIDRYLRIIPADFLSFLNSARSNKCHKIPFRHFLISIKKQRKIHSSVSTCVSDNKWENSKNVFLVCVNCEGCKWHLSLYCTTLIYSIVQLLCMCERERKQKIHIVPLCHRVSSCLSHKCFDIHLKRTFFDKRSKSNYFTINFIFCVGKNSKKVK